MEPTGGRKRSGAWPEHAFQLLSDKIDLLCKEVTRLQSENEALQVKVTELETRRTPAGGTLVPFDASPEALKTQIEAYIRSIDKTIATQAENTDE